MNLEKFSVLMPVYHGDKLKFFSQAIDSVFNQSLEADQIVIVVDGPLDNELRSYIQELDDSKLVDILWLEKNMGLGQALNLGLRACRNSIVARMDADDCAFPDRFEQQIPLMNQYGLISGTLAEFETDPKKITSYRDCLDVNKIEKWYWLRNPFNHPAVIFRKELVEKAGGYLHMPFFEDWYLWIRMIKTGVRCGNVITPVVYFRTGYEQLQRRRGFNYLRYECKFTFKLYKEGYITITHVLSKCMITITFRLLPAKVFKFVTKTVFRR